MNVLELDKKRFEAEILRDGILLVDCWAGWCGACKDFAPVFERVAQRFSRHRFGKLNTQQEQEITGDLGVEHIPTLLLFRDGLLLFKQPGYYDEEKLSDIVRQAESLDMKEVRAQIEAELKNQLGSSDPAQKTEHK